MLYGAVDFLSSDLVVKFMVCICVFVVGNCRFGISKERIFEVCGKKEAFTVTCTGGGLWGESIARGLDL